MITAVRVQQLSALLAARFEGDGDLDVLRVAPLETAGPEEVAFVSSLKFAAAAAVMGFVAYSMILIPGFYGGTATHRAARLLDRPAHFDVFEAGAGNGRLAANLLQALRASEPDLYDAVRYVQQDLTFSDKAAADSSALEH